MTTAIITKTGARILINTVHVGKTLFVVIYRDIRRDWSKGTTPPQKSEITPFNGSELLWHNELRDNAVRKGEKVVKSRCVNN